MDWTTVYIAGKEDFREEVSKKLEHSDLKLMPGNLGSTPEYATDDLYWLDATADLRTFKEAVGGKLIWKYRLRFFDSLESFLEFKDVKKPEPALTSDDLALIEELRLVVADHP